MSKCEKCLPDNRIEVSFCLPVYNVRQFLEDCIRSIHGACIDLMAYEILCIDDGSSDGSYEWLTDYAPTDPRIRILKNGCNKGVSYTRNRLMKEAFGKYIWFVDPDDMLIPGVAGEFLREIRQVDADILLGNYIRVPEAFRLEQYTMTNNTLESDPEKKQDYLPVDLNKIRMHAIWGGLFKRSFLLEHDLRMNEKMIAQEDTLFYYEFSLRTQNIYKWEKYCYLYRQRHSSVMHMRNDRREKGYYLSMREMLRVYERHLEENDYQDIEALKHKIHHSYQNVATCLAAVHDVSFIRNELRELKREKIYPYRFRTETLKGRQPFVIKVLAFLVPMEPFFWLYHAMQMLRNRVRKTGR